MKLKFAGAIAAGLAAVAGAGISPASATAFLVNFDPPTVPQGPSIYVAVPAQQTIVTEPATFTGGVVLGFATFFPAIVFATAPNVYGTADFGNNLAKALTITINNSAINPTTNEVSFALFNGETFSQSYIVDALDAQNNVIATQTLTNVAPNFNSGFGLIDLLASSIAKVTIAPTGTPTVWDFVIDSVAFNQNVANVIIPPVPLPPVQPPDPLQPSPPQVFEPLPPAPPVNARRLHPPLHGHGEPEVELLDSVEINYGDDINDVKGSFLVVTPASPNPTIPEPETYALMLAGLGVMGFVTRRRKQQAA